MKSIIQLKTATPPLLITLVIAFFALSPGAQAVGPEAPDAALPNGNTAEGDGALSGLTGGFYNSAFGFLSLLSNADASFNTGVGAGTLLVNTANENTATGAGALLSNTTGAQNTASGAFALFSNSTGTANTAIGDRALFNDTEGAGNVAVGFEALFLNTTVGFNTAVGSQALFANVTGLENTAIGYQALLDSTGNFNTAVGGAALLGNTTGNDNTACGAGALNDTTGNDNTAFGFQAGIFATNGDGNVYIGAGMSGVAGESDHTYIRNVNTTTVSGGSADFVTVDLTTGLLGHLSSSRRYKEEIKSMDNASQALFALKPVIFRYKKDIDQSQSLDYGLIAEDVAQVDPNLAIHDRSGQIESVRYSAINAMLLNEFLKEHRKVQEQEATIAQLKKDFRATVAQLATRLDEQAAQIQKVSAQLKASTVTPQIVSNQ